MRLGNVKIAALKRAEMLLIKLNEPQTDFPSNTSINRNETIKEKGEYEIELISVRDDNLTIIFNILILLTYLFLPAIYYCCI